MAFLVIDLPTLNRKPRCGLASSFERRRDNGARNHLLYCKETFDQLLRALAALADNF
jgi:hypothetical protein